MNVYLGLAVADRQPTTLLPMTYHGCRCSRCGGPAMTDTDGAGKIYDVCEVCDLGKVRPTPVFRPPDIRPHDYGTVACCECGVTVKKLSVTHVRCGPCAEERSRAKAREREKGRKKRPRDNDWLRQHFLAKSALDIAIG